MSTRISNNREKFFFIDLQILFKWRNCYGRQCAKRKQSQRRIGRAWTCSHRIFIQIHLHGNSIESVGSNSFSLTVRLRIHAGVVFNARTKRAPRCTHSYVYIISFSERNQIKADLFNFLVMQFSSLLSALYSSNEMRHLQLQLHALLKSFSTFSFLWRKAERY